MEKVIGHALARPAGAAAPVSHRTGIMAMAFFALYIALYWLTYVFPARFGITPFNPEAAAAIALLMFRGWRYLPLVFVAVLWGEYALPALATQVGESLRAQALAAHVTVTSGARAPIPPVLMDAVQIEVVLRNLLLNAIDSAAGSADSAVAVEMEATKAGEVVVAVRDSGAGIPESEQERLFESFVTTKTCGMGMGLAISRAIVEAHGGRIWAVPGNAGLLCFTLPLDAAADAHLGASLDGEIAK